MERASPAEWSRWWNTAASVFAADHSPGGHRLPGQRATLRVPSESQFRASFREKSIAATTARNRRIIRYILCELERHLSGVHLDVDDGAVTLEHVCPANPQDGWTQFTDEELDALTQRPGNVVLLERNRNRDIGNADFNTKRAAYGRSVYRTTREFAEKHVEWTPERVGARQAAMAATASAVWRVGQLE